MTTQEKLTHYSRYLTETLDYSKSRDFKGWDKHDGLNSIIGRMTGFRFKYLNLVVQQIVKKSPINIRPFLFIEKLHSFKGVSLFLMAYINLYKVTENREYLDQAKELVSKLKTISVPGFSGFCGAHRHPRQQRDKFLPASTPSIVPTYFGARALIEYYKVTGDQDVLNTALSSLNFLLNELEYTEIDDYARIKYKPNDSGSYYVLNANALGARLLVELSSYHTDKSLLDKAKKILTYIANYQTAEGGWYYTVPREFSHLGMDHYHNGFILEAFLDYSSQINDDSFDGVLAKGLTFYQNVLNSPDGSPNWDEKSVFPKDIHACAETILVHCMTDQLDRAENALNWTVNHLYEDGKFFYQLTKSFKNKTVLMRWGQAWMSFAISCYLLKLKRGIGSE